MATADAGDGEMHERIVRHRNSRPEDWITLELKVDSEVPDIPVDVEVALLDCFTVYLSNLMALNGLDWAPEEENRMAEAEVLERMEKVEEEALKTLDEIRKSVPTLILVSNEVGMGLVPPFRLGRIFRDLAGRLNQRLSEESDEVYAVFTGMPLRLKPQMKEEE